MTIGVAGNRVSFNCDGVTTVFPVNLQAYLASDFTVILTAPASAGGTQTVLVLNSGYSMVATGTLQPTYWTLTTLGAAYATGYSVSVFVNPAQVQQTQYVQGQAFPSLAVQTNLDRLTQMAQRLQDQVNRSVRAPDGDVNPAMLLPTATARANTVAAFDANGNLSVATTLPAGSLSQSSIISFLGVDPIQRQTAIELGLGITPSNLAYGLGSLYRYGAKGGASRVSDAVISASSAILTTVTGSSNSYAKAQPGMTAVVVDGGASRAGGRPAPLITTIASVQSANQITLNATVTQPGTVIMTGTLNGTTSVTATSLNPITAGICLTRIWTVAGANIPLGTTIAATSASTLTLSAAATGSGATSLTLSAPIEVCFGFDDSAAINAALSLPYAIPDVKDNFLTTLPMAVGGTGCNNVSLPSALIICAIANNTQHCVTAAGFDQATLGAMPYQNGMRFKKFALDMAYDCCNTGLDGFSVGQSYMSKMRVRCENPFRNLLSEWFTVNNTWQESNQVDISGSMVGLHFHHKVNLGNVFQTQSNYRILGRACGLNSGYLGINVSTQAAQCGGAIRIYAGGNSSTADGGISQNSWGTVGGCEMDGERSVALSFGSDICNSAVTFVDASASYVIEGPAQAHYSNTYRSNVFLTMVIEDITQSADARGGYQYYAMPNIILNDTTVLSNSAGPWGQVLYNPLFVVAGSDNWIRNTNNISYSCSLALSQGLAINGATITAQQTGWGTPTAGAVVANYNGASATLVQTSNALSSVLTALKNFGLLGS